MGGMTCGVCTEEYRTAGRPPLVLPCGHTYCKVCLLSLCRGKGSLECPVCRRICPSSFINRLPTNFAVISLMSTKTSMVTCEEHGDALRFWCRDCEQSGCGVCMFEAHPLNQHNVAKLQNTLDERKQALKNHVNNHYKLINENLTKLESEMRDCEEKMTSLLYECATLKTYDQQLDSLLDKTELAKEMTSLKSLEAESKDFELKLKNIQEVNPDEVQILRTCDESTDEDERNNEEGTEAAESKSTEQAVCDARLSVTFLYRLSGRTSRLEQDKARLLLCTDPSDFCWSHQLAQLMTVDHLRVCNEPEVFLELSAGETVLGKVYICLWVHLRRAQNFLALCLGTFGPSFLGSQLFKVSDRHQPNESVTLGSYRALSGSFTSEAILANLEWGGPYVKERSEGLVVASSGGDPDYDSLCHQHQQKSLGKSALCLRESGRWPERSEDSHEV